MQLTAFYRKFYQLILFIFCQLYACSVFANPVCLIVATGPNAIYDPLGSSNVEAVGNIQISCTYTGIGSTMPAYQIQLSTGNSNSYINRTLRSLNQSLIYNLYVNASHSLVWGNGAGGTSTVNDAYAMTAGTVIKNHPVYMRIPGSQLVNAASYLDQITVTVNY